MSFQDNIDYAMQTTRVLHEPDHRIRTFGETRFEFQLITEPMDQVGRVKIRTGEVEAMKPRILRPSAYQDIELEGFDPEVKARLDRMLDKLRAQGRDLAFMQYGFQFKRGEVSEEIIHDSIQNVSERLLEEIRRTGNPARAIIEGVDDAWEICILKFSLDMIQRSHEINAFDFRRKGLI